MTPPVATSARPSHSRKPARQGAESRRAPLRIVERSSRRRRVRLPQRATTWMSVALVGASLLAVVVGDDLVTQGQIRLSSIENQVASATATVKSQQVTVAQLAASTRVVRMAEQDGYVAPPTVTDLPAVSLEVPLPEPATGPPPTSARR